MRVEVRIDDHVAVAKLGKLTENTRRRLRAVIVKDGPILAAKVRAKMSNDLLKIRSGRLLVSVKNEMVENANSIYGRVYSEGVPYARIQEYGGTTRAHMIYPVKAQALRFMVGNKVVFAMSVSHPGSKIPPRPAFARSLDEMRQRIIDDFKAAVGW